MALRKPKKKKAVKPVRARTRKASARPTRTDQGAWPYVEVHWRDATSESSWRGHDELPETSMIVTRGWLVRTTKICITIAASLAMIDHKDSKDDRADCGEIITIPRGCIVPDGLVMLEVKPAPKKKVTLN